MELHENENHTRLKRALASLQQLRARLEDIEQQEHEPIAVIGMGCRFPGDANSPEAFWHLLSMEIDAICEVPRNRWDIDEFYDSDPEIPGKVWVRYGGYLKDIDQFDSDFFRILPREARHLDPQQRLLLEVSWEALERANIAPDKLYDSPTGVFIGMSHSDYMHMELADYAGIDTYSVTGSAWSIAAGRIAYTLGLHGPAMAIDTACSSSLTAIHLACQSLRQKECELALAGGVNLMISPAISINFSKARLLSPDGRCKTFDARADGYGRGEGCGVIVLKRLSRAIADGNNILGLIKGSAVNQDGRSSGITAPNGSAQAKLLQQALINAKVQSHMISYVEAHGTGTALGDPIEMGSIYKVLSHGRSTNQPLLVGSVKSNIGHLEAAAGVASVCKVLLSLQQRQLPASLHFSTPNPHIDWDEINVAVVQALQPWQPINNRRIAVINSFGFSGTNVSLVVEEAPSPIVAIVNPIDAPVLLPFSAHSSSALVEIARRYQSYIKANRATSLAALAYYLGTGRAHLAYRAAFLVSHPDELYMQLDKLIKDNQHDRSRITATKPVVAFLCTGQGPQYIDMGQQLYQDQPIFRKAVDECAAIVSPWLKHSLTAILFPDIGQEKLINHTLYTPPAMFALEYGLAQLWMHWGIQPDVLIGHSFGEYVAACLANVFSLEDALRLVVNRAALIDQLALQGAMASASGDKSLIERIVSKYEPDVVIAVDNGPQDVVLAGDAIILKQVCTHLTEAGISIRNLAITHASHSPLIEPVLDAYYQIASQVSYKPPQRPLIANLTGTWADESMASAEYWCSHLRHSVRFGDSLKLAQEYGCQCFIEIGPRSTLIGLAGKAIPDALALVPSLHPEVNSWKTLLSGLGKLYCLGADINWQHVPIETYQPQLDLPTYPFQRQRHWLHAESTLYRTFMAVPGNTPQHPLLGVQFSSPLSQLIYTNTLSLYSHEWFIDHQVFDLVVVPGSTFIEIMLAVSKALGQSTQWYIHNIVIQQPLVLKDHVHCRLQIVVSADTDQCNVEIYSQVLESNEATQNWVLHAIGQLTTHKHISYLINPTLVELQAQAQPDNNNPSIWYACFQQYGLNYGPQFQIIQQRWRTPAGWLARLNPTALQREYYLHPALLDAGFQSLMLSILQNSGDPYLPFSIDHVHWFENKDPITWAYGAWRDSFNDASDIIIGDIWLYAENGELIAIIEGLTGRRASRISFDYARSVNNDLYLVKWEPENLNVPHSRVNDGTWVIWTDSVDLGMAFARQADLHQEPVLLVGPHVIASSIHHITLQEDNPELLLDWLTSHPCRGILYFASDQNSAVLDQQSDCHQLLLFIQGLTRKSVDQSVRLRIVTFGAQAVLAEAPNLAQSTVWGLGRTIANEYPELWGGLLDLEPNKEAQTVLMSFAERYAPADFVAYRGNTRYVQRISSVKSMDQQVPMRQLVSDTSSTLEGLHFVPYKRRQPAPDEIEIRVCANGMNFRDIANVLILVDQENVYFGGECAGIIVDVGSHVTDFKVGDIVCAIAFGSYSTYVTVPESQVIHIPKGLTFLQAASLPIAFVTAYYALHSIASIKAGDRVLIHAATGGVGQAAVQLAQQAGATIYATAGSENKRQWLHDQGIKYVFNSRSLDFAEEIAMLTEGEGVDIVLNSFTGDYIPLGLKLVKQDGHFIELGKATILQPKEVATINAAACYTAFDIGEVSLGNPQLIQTILTQIGVWYEQGTLEPLPVTEFVLDDIHTAFRYMAQAKHIGKIVISQPEAISTINQICSVAFHKQATYLITGGLGGLGLLTAGWLIEQGAGHIVLIGRREPATAAAEQIAFWRQNGIQVEVVNGDVSNMADVQAILTKITAAMPPLRGVFHAAGVLDDGIIAQQNWAQFRQVMLPKIQGAWNLHQATATIDLDYFILFSSLSSVIGMLGQSNYVVANTYLDSLAAYRQAHGLPALSISWGAWAEVGLAAIISAQDQKRRQQFGIDLISPQHGLNLLESSLKVSAPHVIAAAVDWQRLSSALPSLKPLCDDLLNISHSNMMPQLPRTESFLEQLTRVPAHQQPILLRQTVYNHLVNILGFSESEQLSPNQRLFDVGLDSLMAIELRNAFQNTFQQALPATLLFEHPTPEGLIKYLSKRLLQSHAVEEPVALLAEDILLNEITAMDEDILDTFVNDVINKHLGSGKHHD